MVERLLSEYLNEVVTDRSGSSQARSVGRDLSQIRRYRPAGVRAAAVRRFATGHGDTVRRTEGPLDDYHRAYVRRR